MPCPGRNSLVKGGRPVLLGSLLSNPWEYIQLPNVAHADELCHPYGSLELAGWAAGRVCLIDLSCSFGSSEGLALTTSSAALAGSARTARSPRVNACRKARRSTPSVCASPSRTTSTSSS